MTGTKTLSRNPRIPDLAVLFDRHEKAVLGFSGGKDSLVCLDLCRPYRDRLDVCWVNTGAMFPHMAEFVREAAAGFNFVELSSDVEAWRREYGDPADVVPTFNSFPGLGIKPLQPRTMLSHWTACCLANRTWPLTDYVSKSGATVFLHGQRSADLAMGGFKVRSTPGAPFEAFGPIEDWSDDDVFRYVAEHKIALPKQYGADPPAKRSLECWSCTAMLHEDDRLQYTRVHHPELYKKLRRRLLANYKITQDAVAGTTQVLGHVLVAEKRAGRVARCPDTNIRTSP